MDYIKELKKLELISTARQILNAEYIQKRTDEYAQWNANNKETWQRGNLPLPTFPFLGSAAFASFQPTTPFPTEAAVIAKALELYNREFPQAVSQPEATEEVIEEVIEDTSVPATASFVAEIQTIFEEIPLPVELTVEVSTEPAAEEDLNTVPQPIEELAKVTTSGRILPTVLQRLQSMKDNWTQKNTTQGTTDV